MSDNDNLINDNQNVIDNMIKEEIISRKARKTKLIILFSSIILILIIIIVTIIILISIKNKNENNQNDNSDTNPIIIEPKGGHSYSIIFLHGLNDTAEHFQQFFEDINFAKKNVTKFIFLRAPKMNIYYKNKMNVASWFNVYSLPLNSSDTYNFEDVKKSRNKINEIIINESKLLNHNFSKIILGGHSQGACMSLYIAYNADYVLGGVISLSGVLFEQTEINGNKENLKVFIYHGGNDKQVPIEYHNYTIERIMKYNNSIERVYYPNETHFLEYFSLFKNNFEDFLNQIFI